MRKRRLPGTETIIGVAIFATIIGIASIVNAMKDNPKESNDLIPDLEGMTLIYSEYENATDKIPGFETLVKTYLKKNTLINTLSIDDKIFAYMVSINGGKKSYELIDKEGKGIFSEKDYIGRITIPEWLIEKHKTEITKEHSDKKEIKKPPTSNTVTDAHIKGVTTVEIEQALSAAASVENHFNRPRIKLKDEHEKILQKQVQSIIATKKALSLYGPKEIVVFNQEPGKQITLESVQMSEPGFAIIEYNNRKAIGSSALLKIGSNKSVLIGLNEHVDGETVVVRLYKDDGDGVFDSKKDKCMVDNNGMLMFKQVKVGTVRNLSHTFYSNYLSIGVPSLLLKEQLPGTTIKFSSISFGHKIPAKTNFFLVIRKDRNGFPGKIIGVSNKQRGARSHSKITLQEPVSNETLYAMVYKDNGDRTFNENKDILLRGYENLPIIVKFQVVK